MILILRLLLLRLLLLLEVYLLLFGLLEELFLFTQIELVATKLLLSKLLFPLLTLLPATISAGKAIKLLGVCYLKDMSLLVTTKCDLGWVKAIYDLKTAVYRHIFTGFVELLTLIAPTVITVVYGVRWYLSWYLISCHKEGVTVEALELQGILSFAYTEVAWEAFSFKNLCKFLGSLENCVLRFNCRFSRIIWGTRRGARCRRGFSTQGCKDIGHIGRFKALEFRGAFLFSPSSEEAWIFRCVGISTCCHTCKQHIMVFIFRILGWWIF